MNCETHDFDIEKSPFGVGVFPIIFDEQNRVLLAHRTDHDVWNCPGGGMDSGETPDQTVLRELKEEVCVEAEIVRFAGVYPKNHVDEIVFSFVCKITGGELACTSEADQIEWFAFEDLPRNISVNQIQRIADALFEPDKIHYRVQDAAHTLRLSQEGTLEEVTEKIIQRILKEQTAS